MGRECGTHGKETHANYSLRKPERSRHLGRRGSKKKDNRKNLKETGDKGLKGVSCGPVCTT